jgi:hypothetical protein
MAARKASSASKSTPSKSGGAKKSTSKGK